MSQSEAIRDHLSGREQDNPRAIKSRTERMRAHKTGNTESSSEALHN